MWSSLKWNRATGPFNHISFHWPFSLSRSTVFLDRNYPLYLICIHITSNIRNATPSTDGLYLEFVFCSDGDPWIVDTRDVCRRGSFLNKTDIKIILILNLFHISLRPFWETTICSYVPAGKLSLCLSSLRMDVFF